MRDQTGHRTPDPSEADFNPGQMAENSKCYRCRPVTDNLHAHHRFSHFVAYEALLAVILAQSRHWAFVDTMPCSPPAGHLSSRHVTSATRKDSSGIPDPVLVRSQLRNFSRTERPLLLPSCSSKLGDGTRPSQLIVLVYSVCTQSVPKDQAMHAWRGMTSHRG